MTTARVELPPKIVPVLGPPRGCAAYRALYGGRGSAKSQSGAIISAVWGYAEPLRILCVREFQASIAESFHAELRAAIEARPFLAAHYDIGRDYLRGRNGTEFLFRGLRRNAQSIKSLAKIDLTIVEEAEDVPEDSWLALEATVFRQPKSELWAIWNPRAPDSPVDARFRKAPPEGLLSAEVNADDNPFLPEGLRKLRARERDRLPPEVYAHVWEGAYLLHSEAQVFAGCYEVRAFEPGADWDGPYYGADWGFANDPTVLVEAWRAPDGRVAVRRESGGVGIEVDRIGERWGRDIPEAQRATIRADNARPETISFMRRHGWGGVTAAPKWPGSVEDGTEWLRAAGLLIHPECRGTEEEARLHSYKTNAAGDVLPKVADAYNHRLDALRYAFAPMIQAGSYDWSALD